MTLNDMNGQATRDLARFTHGLRGSLQRKFRMVFWIVRMNSLGRRPEVGRSIAEVDAYVLDLMRDAHPGFTPELA